MRNNVALIGFMGTGKSAVGHLVARQLGFQFVDTDSLLVQRAGMEISDIFKKHGEDHFRNLESSVLESLEPMNRCVISTGGGIILRPENRARLQQLGFVVLLTADEDTIRQRVERNTRRPLLQAGDLAETISTMLAARRPLYEATAHLIVDNSTATKHDTARTVVKAARKAFGWDD